MTGILAFTVILAALYALVLKGFLHWRGKPAGLAVPAALWLALPVYNAIVLRYWCSGDCGIRIDLVLIAPLMLLATALALATGRAMLRRRG